MWPPVAAIDIECRANGPLGSAAVGRSQIIEDFDGNAYRAVISSALQGPRAGPCASRRIAAQAEDLRN